MRDGRPLLTAALVALLAGACAKVAPPPGGPEDVDPPTILTELVRPAPGSAGFGAADTVRIVFSERPDRRSVMRALTIVPRVDFRDVVWQEDTLSLVPDPAWAEGRNTLLRISRGARDRRGNPLDHPFSLRFTTQDAADSGTVAGRVWMGRERDDRSPVVLFAFDVADSLDAGVSAPYAIGEAGPNGQFQLGGLDTGKTYRVLALLDRNDDLEPGGRGEVSVAAPDTVRFLEGAAVTLSDFLLGTLDSVATIRGEIAADSGVAAFARARLAADSATAGQTWSSDALRGGGGFRIDVPTGAVYRVFAFADADGDSAPGAAETREEAQDAIDLRFTTGAEGVRFDLSTPEPIESLELQKGSAAAGGGAADSAATKPAGGEGVAGEGARSEGGGEDGTPPAPPEPEAPE